MALITGTPLGVVLTSDDIYIADAPPIFFQDRTNSNPLNNPDADGFYWGLTGSAAIPVYELRCTDTEVLAANYDINQIRCDTVGDVGAIQKLNYLDLTFNLKTPFPLTQLTHIIRGGTVTVNAGATEKMGIGQPDNNQFYRAYLPSVYDPDTGDYVSITLHRAQFVEGWQFQWTYGQPMTIPVTMRGFADSSLPAAQQFATIIRADPSAI